MSDFASAAMVGVVLSGMEKLGLDTQAVQHLAPTKGAHIPLHAKQMLVAAAMAQGGWASLVQLGQGFHAHTDAPLHRALASAPDASTLLARWCRLEKYVHSRHRVQCVQVLHHQARLQHISLALHTPPSAAEDLVVLGLLCALLQAQGLQQVRAEIQGVAVFPTMDIQALPALALRGQTAHWTLRWDSPATTSPKQRIPPASTPDQLPTNLCDAMPWSTLALQCAHAFLEDLMHTHSVASIAHSLDLSARSLQRHLKYQGLSVSRIAAEVRLRSSAWWLLETPLSLAETGFVCGFADQAHFNRSFKRHTGLTPGAYRTSFGVTK
ncbi:MAG: helix-turn-helix transcriptional regulator [Rhodoferax sp.]|nr:helix-turn-helix transcriptional regulator [Rhodoferax sp.]